MNKMVFEKLKKNKLVRSIALACAGLGCLYSTPAFADKPKTKYELNLSDSFEKPAPKFLKIKKNQRNDTLDNKIQPLGNYVPYVAEEDRKFNYGNLPGYTTLEDLMPKSFKEIKIDSLGSIDKKPNILLNALTGYALTVGWHEFGHYITGNINGYKNVKMHGPGNGNIASVSTSTSVNKDKKKGTVFYAGGIGFTTLGDVTLESLLKTNNVPASLRPLVATTALFMLFDRHRYLWSTAIKKFAGVKISGYNDIKQMVDLNLDFRGNKNTVYGIALAASALELYFRKDDIWNLFQTAIGSEPRSSEKKSNLELGTYLANNGIFFGVRGNW